MTSLKLLILAAAFGASLTAWSFEAPRAAPLSPKSQAELRRGVVGSWRVVARQHSDGTVVHVGEDLSDPIGSALTFGGDGTFRTQHQDQRWRLEGSNLVTSEATFRAERWGKGELEIYDYGR